MPILRKIQLGKNGVTDNFIVSLENQFKKTKNVKIGVLKSSGRGKIKEDADKIVENLDGNYSYKIIGFVINVKKLRGKKSESKD